MNKATNSRQIITDIALSLVRKFFSSQKALHFKNPPGFVVTPIFLLMNIHTNFGFAIELFFVVFWFLCWLITPSQRPENAIEPVSSFSVKEVRENSKPEIKKFSDPTPSTTEWEKLWSDFSFHEVRKLASHLKSCGFLSDIKLKGKGVTRDFLLESIKKSLPQSFDDIISCVSINGLGIKKNA